MVRLYFLLSIIILFTCSATAKLIQDRSLKITPQLKVQKHIDSINRAALKIYTTNPSQARQMAQSALLLARQNKYAVGQGEALLYIGKSYWAQSYYPISLFYLNSALPYLQAGQAHLSLSDCYRCIGRNYIDLKKNPEALTFLKKSLQEAGLNKLQRGLAFSERSLAFIQLNRYDDALNDISIAMKLCRQIHQNGNLAILYTRLFNFYINRKQYDKASAYIDTAYKMGVANGNKRLQAISLQSKALIAYRQKKYTEAISIAQRSAALADSIGVLDTYSRDNKLLYQIYEDTHNLNKALFYQKKYIVLQDSLNKADKQSSASLIFDYFSLTNKLHDIDEIDQKNTVNGILIKSQQTAIISLVVAILVLVIAIYLLYRYSTQKNILSKQLNEKHEEAIRQNKLIETQAANLTELNALKDRLLAIIGHDLKSPLVNVRSIVDLFTQDYITAAEVPGLMRDVDPAIKGAELTLTNLAEWAGNHVKGNHIKIVNVDLLSVAEEMNQVFNYSLVKKGISLLIAILPGTHIQADDNHVRMILRNFISNSIKFTPGGGTITISANSSAETGKLVTSVTDTGKGIPAHELNRLFSLQTHFTKAGTGGEMGTGIGLLLCKQLVELNGGEIGATSIPGEGSTFYFSLPV